MCLASSAGVVPNVESTTAMQQQAPAIGRYVRQLIAGDHTQLVSAYVAIAQQLLTAFNGDCLLTFCCDSVSSIVCRYMRYGRNSITLISLYISCVT